MEQYFNIGEAAEMAGMTRETLRHYDRIGLVRPSGRDPSSGYRRYSKEDIVRLSAVQALSCMDLSLKEIAGVLSYRDPAQIAAFLDQADQRAGEKIIRLSAAREKLRRARADFDKTVPAMGVQIKALPRRVILLSKTLEKPALSNLWNYQSAFFDQLSEEERDAFAFENRAGVYTSESGEQRLFALCTRWRDVPEIRILPGGDYLCAPAAEENREQTVRELCARAKISGGAGFCAEMIEVTGVLSWQYEIQAPLFSNE